MPADLHHAEPVESCVSTQIEGLTLLYHRPSGVTHFLSSPMPEILALLTAEPCGIDILTERLCLQLDAPCDDEARTVVTARVSELEQIGLVHSSRCTN